jgi:hypothetical protein
MFACYLFLLNNLHAFLYNYTKHPKHILKHVQTHSRRIDIYCKYCKHLIDIFLPFHTVEMYILYSTTVQYYNILDVFLTIMQSVLLFWPVFKKLFYCAFATYRSSHGHFVVAEWESSEFNIKMRMKSIQTGYHFSACCVLAKRNIAS